MIKEANYKDLMRVFACISQDRGLQELILKFLKEDLHQVKAQLTNLCWAFNLDFFHEQAEQNFREKVFQNYQISSDLVEERLESEITADPDCLARLVLAQNILEEISDVLVKERINRRDNGIFKGGQ